MFLDSFPDVWWPNIWPKMEFLERSIRFIPGIYPYGVSLLTPIHFRVPSLIFRPLVAKYLAENGVSGIFWKTIGSIHYILGIYPYGDIWMRIFLDEVGSDQIGGILSPFMGTACCTWELSHTSHLDCAWKFMLHFCSIAYIYRATIESC